jgi:acyl carrier protein
MPADTFERVRDLVAAHLKVDPGRITRETSLAQDLGADSVDALELVCQIEEAFEIRVPGDRVSEFVTVGAICEGLNLLKDAALRPATQPPPDRSGPAA